MLLFPGFDTDKYLFYQEPDPRKKTANYYLTNICSMYSSWLRGQSVVGYTDLLSIERMRAFSEGRQTHPKSKITSEEKYSPLLDQNGNRIKKEVDMFEGYNPNHEVYEIISPANKIMDALYGSLSKIDFNISCDPLDYATQQSVEDEKLKAWVYAKNQKIIKKAAEIAGIQVPEPDVVPEAPEDLEDNADKFLPDHAKFVEQVVKHSFDISHWSPDIVQLYYRDLFANGRGCVKNEYDPSDGKVKPTYIDLTMAYGQTSKWVDCRDQERGGHFELMSITRLKLYFPDKPQEWFEKIAQNYCGQFGNPMPGLWDRYNIMDPYGNYLYDSFVACVFHGEWIDTEKIREAVGTKHGRKTVKEVPLDEKITTDKAERFRDERKRFQCSWVVGVEDGMFNYGPAIDCTYPSENDTELTYRWTVLKGKSKMEQLVPILVNLQDLWDKWKEQLQNAFGKITMMDIDKLASAQGQADDPQVAAKKAFQRVLKTNMMLIRRVNSAGMPDQNLPLLQEDGGMGPIANEIMVGFKFNMELVEYITGINPLALGQSADPNAPVTTSQMAMNATASVLRPLIDGYMRMKQGIAENLARWIVVAVRGNEFSRRAYASVVGEYGVQCLIAANKSEASYGFTLQPLPDDMQKQWLIQTLTTATTPNANGDREISTSDAGKIIDMIGSKATMKSIYAYFEKAKKKQADDTQKKKEALMQKQSDLNQADAKTSGEEARKTADDAHGKAMELQGKKNEGLIGNTAVQEQMRKDKELAVAKEKKEPEPAPVA